MAANKGKLLNDQKMKLKAIGHHQKWTKNIHWEGPLGIKTSTLSNWRNDRPVGENSIAKLAELIGISTSDLISWPGKKFCEILNVDLEKLGDQNSTPEIFNHSDVVAGDRSIMNSLSDTYLGFFLSREGADNAKEYIAVEKFEISGKNSREDVVKFFQVKNQIVNNRTDGALRVTNERAVGYVVYEEYYPPSLYYLIPFRVMDSAVLLYGLYTDVTPVPTKEVFCVKIVLIPMTPKMQLIDKRIDKGFWLYEILHPALQDMEPAILDGTFRKRKVVEGSRKTSNLIETIWDQVK